MMTNTNTNTEATCLNLTLADIRNAWKHGAVELHDNNDDGTLPEYDGDSQCLYKAYDIKVNGRVIVLTYSEEMGYELTLDGKPADIDDLFVDDEDAFDDEWYREGFTKNDLGDYLDELTGETMTDLDDLRLAAEYEWADGIAYAEDNEQGIEIEVREKADGTYIAKRTQDYEVEYIDDFDWDGAVEATRDAIRSANEAQYEYAAKFLKEIVEDENGWRDDDDQLTAVVDEKVAEECIESYTEGSLDNDTALAYYYFDLGDSRREQEFAAAMTDGGDTSAYKEHLKVVDASGNTYSWEHDSHNQYRQWKFTKNEKQA